MPKCKKSKSSIRHKRRCESSSSNDSTNDDIISPERNPFIVSRVSCNSSCGPKKAKCKSMIRCLVHSFKVGFMTAGYILTFLLGLSLIYMGAMFIFVESSARAMQGLLKELITKEKSFYATNSIAMCFLCEWFSYIMIFQGSFLVHTCFKCLDTLTLDCGCK